MHSNVQNWFNSRIDVHEARDHMTALEHTPNKLKIMCFNNLGYRCVLNNYNRTCIATVEQIEHTQLEWNPSIAATLEEQNFGRYNL